MSRKLILILAFGLILLNCANLQPELKAMTATIQKIQDASCGNCDGKISITYTKTCQDDLKYQDYGIDTSNTIIHQGDLTDSTTVVIMENLCPGTYHIYAMASYFIIEGQLSWAVINEGYITINGSTNPPEITGAFGPRVSDCYKSGWGQYAIDTNIVEMEPGGTITWTKDGQPFPAGDGHTSIDSLEAGTYRMIVTDKNGCSDTVSFTILTQKDQINYTAQVKPSGCDGTDSSGSVTLNYSSPRIIAIPAPNIDLPNGTGGSWTDLPPGDGMIVLVDMLTGCTKHFYYHIDDVDQIRATLTSKNPGCNGLPNSGSTTVNVTSGTPPYQYTWTPNVSSTNTASGLWPGLYSVTVTDSNGCSITLQTLLLLVPQLDFTITVYQYKSTHDSCASRAWVSNLVGTPPFTYEWSDGSTSATSFEHLPGGGVTYTCIVTDANGCQTTHTVVSGDCLEGDNFLSSPNPVDDFVNLNYTTILQNPSLKFIVRDQDANIMEIRDIGHNYISPINITLDTSGYLAGVYFVTAYENNVPTPMAVRFVKQ